MLETRSAMLSSPMENVRSLMPNHLFTLICVRSCPGTIYREDGREKRGNNTGCTVKPFNSQDRSTTCPTDVLSWTNYSILKYGRQES